MKRETAEQVVTALTQYFEFAYQVTPDFFLADHNHEEIREGAWSIAWEGWSDENGYAWTYCLPEREDYKSAGIPDDVFLEPLFSWCLGVYDMDW